MNVSAVLVVAIFSTMMLFLVLVSAVGLWRPGNRELVRLPEDYDFWWWTRDGEETECDGDDQ